MRKIVIFTGAGVSAESGIETFRDIKDGLWYNYKVDDVATIEGWKKDRETVLDFHNMLRAKSHTVKPNEAHHLLSQLQEDFQVTIITQNVDELHEKAGSKRIYHLHGELMKTRSSLDPSLIYDCRGSISIGDKCEKGSQLRPHTVLFGEYPFNVEESYEALAEADYLIVVGTSFQIYYTIDMIKSVKPGAKIFYVDPNPVEGVFHDMDVEYIYKNATVGVQQVYDKIYELEF